MYGQKEVCGHVEGVCGGVKEGWYGCVMCGCGFMEESV